MSWQTPEEVNNPPPVEAGASVKVHQTNVLETELR